MQFRCPTCSELMQCPNDLAGTKAACPKCGQRVQVPAPPKPPTNKTKLGEFVDTAAPPATPPPAAPAAPSLPQKKSPRRFWIAAAIAGGLVSCLLCIGGGVGLSYVFNVGPLARASVIGKWESAGTRAPGMKVEFKADGTGVFTTPWMFAGMLKLTPKQLADIGVVNDVHRDEFTWRIEHDKRPVLVVELTAKPAGPLAGIRPGTNPLAPLALYMPGGKGSYHFKREGDTLKLYLLEGMPFQAAGGDEMALFVFRRAK